MFTLTGTIIDHTGAPRAYVDVNITPVPAVTPTGASLAAGGRRIRTDSLGQFSIDLVHAPGQTYQVSVPAANIFQRFPVPEADGSTIDLHEVTEIMVPTPLSPVVRGLPGKSTYDLAVETGFEGTLEEWLEAQKAVAAAHGSLTGLDDDDHTQYLTEARGDARYLTADDIPDLSEIPDLSDVIREGDARLSDAREPTEHSHPEYLTADDIPDLPDLSGVVRDDDPRLSDAREPTAHSHPEYLTAEDLPEAPDLSDVVREGDARLSDPRPPTEHRHAWSDLDDTPDIPATPEDIGAQPAGDYATRDEIPEVPPAPDLSGFVTDDDPRLSDAREPTEHDHDGRYVRTVNGNGPDETGNVTVEGGGGEGGTDDHRALSYRSAPDAHPISAITGLTDALESKQPVGDYLTSEDLPEAPDLSDVVREGDPRLSDARDPNQHRHAWADLDDPPTIPATPEDIGAQPAGDYAAADHDHDDVYVKPADLPDVSDVVREGDPRLTDDRTPTVHDHAIDDVTGLQDALDGKAATAHDHDDRYYTEDEVDSALAGKANTSHTHADYAPATHDHDGTYQPVGDYAAGTHTHTEYVETTDPRLSDARTPTAHDHTIGDVTGLQSALDGKQPSGSYAPATHDHDDRYYTESEVDTALAGKADATHQHNYSDISDPPVIPASPADIGAQPAGDYLTASDLPAPPDLSDVVRDDDPRLSDAREPTAHSHPEYLTADDVPEFPDLSAFVETDDERLSDARAPLAHEHQIEDVEGLAASLADFQPRGEYLVPGDLPDLSDVVREDDERLSDARTPTDHRHAWTDLDDTPAIPASPEDIGAQPAGDYLTAEDLPEAPDLSDVVRDDDPRLSDARPPTEHDHDDRYYTEDEVDTALDGKADTSHSHPVTDLTATGTPSEATYLRGDGAWATPEGQGPSHESILASGNVTLPVEHPVLTIRADDPATLSLPEAPDGTVVTIHVAHGWENLTWGPGITVTGDSTTTETWVVLVRAEGAWKALVSGESGGGSGILTGNGNPNTLGIKAATVGVLYADEAKTDGAALWSADSVDDWDGTTKWVVVNGYADKWAAAGGMELYITRYGPRLVVYVSVDLTGGGSGEEVTLPASTIDVGEVDEGFRGNPFAGTLVLVTSSWTPPVELPPIVCVFTQIGRYVLHMPEIVIPAYTAPDPVTVTGSLELVTEGPWPKGSGGGGVGV